MPKTIKHKEKSDYLLQKGVELFWSKGYNATSVNDIVKEANVPKGSFYFYFESKEDFAVKALEKYFHDDAGLELIQILEDKSIPPKERIIKFYEGRMHKLKDELSCKMGCMGCNLGNEMAEHSEAIRKVVFEEQEKVKAIIIQVVEEAQEAGEIDKTLNARDLVGFMEDAGKGAMITMKEMKSAYPLDNMMNMIQVLLR